MKLYYKEQTRMSLNNFGLSVAIIYCMKAKIAELAKQSFSIELEAYNILILELYI